MLKDMLILCISILVIALSGITILIGSLLVTMPS